MHKILKIHSIHLILVKLCMELKFTYFCASFFGDVAQLVEQRTENPCVGGSIPSITTQKASLTRLFLSMSMIDFDNLAKCICILTFNVYLKFDMNGFI
jgi:hypothetical protein